MGDVDPRDDPAVRVITVRTAGEYNALYVEHFEHRPTIADQGLLRKGVENFYLDPETLVVLLTPGEEEEAWEA